MSKSTTKNKAKKKVTPLMKQYFDLKSKYSDAILLFRVGDFYETFGEDAITASQILGIVLTKRNNGGSDIELAGFPHHSVNLYMPRLVKAGYRVAICEQLEKPSKEKKIVKRGVTDVVTPGVTFNDALLDQNSNNFLCAIHTINSEKFGISFLDVSTAEFYYTEDNVDQLLKLLESFQPTEILVAKSNKETLVQLTGENFYIYTLEDWVFQKDFCEEKLQNHFNVISLKGFGIDQFHLAQIACGSILHYLDSTENKQLKHISKLQRLHASDFVWLDNFTIRNLELIRSQHLSGKSLLESIDNTVSPMGARMLMKWIIMPLVSVKQIHNRLNAVEHLYGSEALIEELKSYLRRLGDLERLASKISTLRISPKQVHSLIGACESFAEIKNLLDHTGNDQLRLLSDQINPCKTLLEKIKAALSDDPPVQIQKGNCIRTGYNSDLDELRTIITNSKELLLNIQNKESEATGITNLKIGFNNVFGYYLEVTNKYKNLGLIPDHWVRKQTLTGSERYITDELKVLESKILTAEDQIFELESNLYADLLQFLHGHIQSIQLNANILAKTDCLISFASTAKANNYCKPEVNESYILDIKAGRHPVIEKQMPPGESYVANDLYLDNETQQIIMITGPNMSGKSAVLRQTALICLMAQCGSFVPADQATIGVIDKLFTRVGASDNISSGESTFMVEMNETSNIMNNISSRSLILLDEIGRGTSTYDGISIAWSIAEYLHENAEKPKTLFATHYHELNELANKYDRIKNFNVSTKQTGDKVIFLRKLQEGGSLHSFGIQVASLAGMPDAIVKRANDILGELEKKSLKNEEGDLAKRIKPKAPEMQLKFFAAEDPKYLEFIKEIEKMDLNSMTPVECMLALIDLQKRICD